MALPRHGHWVNGKASPTYHSWRSLRYRTRDTENNKSRYRGMYVDPKWDSFEEFLADMGVRPDGTTIDRIDNSQGYFKENCRWATPVEQARNRQTSVFPGKSMRSAAEEAGIDPQVVLSRRKRGTPLQHLLLPKLPYTRRNKLAKLENFDE